MSDTLTLFKVQGHNGNVSIFEHMSLVIRDMLETDTQIMVMIIIDSRRYQVADGSISGVFLPTS